jgi:8-oxo-dGTP pyrophosphatase MutT (NUDIX family)
MENNLIKNITKTLNNNTLPGVIAHNKMLPHNRITPDKLETQINSIKSSVLVLLYPDISNNIKLVLIKRQDYKGVHGGQIAFPGGKKELSDLNDEYTAIRETFEEIGVRISFDNIIGRLSDIYIPPSNNLLTPIVAYIEHKPDFKINNFEVKEIIELNINDLINDNFLSEDVFETIYGNVKAPCFIFNSYKVWGATAMILNELKIVINNLQKS